MSGGGSSQPQIMMMPQQQQATTTNQLPSWVQQAGQQNYNLAQQIGQQQMGQYYTGPRVADMNQGQLNAINSLNNNVGSYDPAFNSAMNTATNLQGFTPNQINAQSLAGTNLNPYMNPYTNNVINSSLAVLDQQRQNNLNTNRDQAIASKAFGGSRQAIQDAITNSQYGLQGANMASNLYNQNFLNAQNAANQDISNNIQSQLANQNAGLQGANLNLNAANQLGNLASSQQQNFLNAQNAALSGSGMLQQQQQNQLGANQQAFADQQQSYINPLNMQIAALANTPYNTSSSTNSSGFTSQLYQPTSNSPLMSGLGGALGGLGALGKFMSDEDEKMNIKKLGKDPITGIPMYAYDYKDDVEDAKEEGKPMPPKRVGPMAQDIEKVTPEKVRKVGGKKIVNLGFGRGE